MGDLRFKPCIITFIGPVGVGKSTQIRLLIEYLESNNIRVARTFIKSNHLFTYILGSSLKKLGVSEEVVYSNGYAKTYPRREVVRRLFSLWCLLDVLSITAKFLFTVNIPFRLGFTVLIEEGLSMSQYTYVMSLPRFLKTKPTFLPLLPILLAWISCRRHLNIIIDASEEELNRRRKSRSYRQNELPEYVSMQKSWIKRLNLSQAVVIDTSNASLSDVHAKIVTAIEKQMLGNCA